MDERDALKTVQAEIAQLRDRYVARLPAEVTEMTELAGRLKGDENDRPTLDFLRHRLHRLAGSGGTFGFHALGAKARLLEQEVSQWLEDPVLADGPTLEHFGDGIASLATLQGAGPSGPAAVDVAMPPAPASGQPARIWVVDDDELLGGELARLLAQFGYVTRLFTRFDDANAAARAGERPDILILDVLFPDENLNATEALFRGSALDTLGCPLLFVTAFSDFPSQLRAARLGASGFMEKPLDVPKLVDRLERMHDTSPATPHQVLIVDDDVDLAEHYRLVLTAAGMEVAVENLPEQVMERVATFRPELLLLDMYMPGYTGPELATVIRYRDEWLSLPIVYLSAETDLDKQIKALGHGADDFLTKSISDAQLLASVRVRVARSRQLADLMSKDSLTDLLKHARIKEEIDIELTRAQRSGKPVCVAMVDIDHFKLVNDTYGHAVGDRVIRAIAHLLRQRLRKSDGIGRYGGEEFVVVLPECDEVMAKAILEDNRERFGALRFRHEEQEFACTLSAGVACANSGQTVAGGDLLVTADEALYAAKHGGRNQVRIGQVGAKATAGTT